MDFLTLGDKDTGGWATSFNPVNFYGQLWVQTQSVPWDVSKPARDKRMTRTRMWVSAPGEIQVGQGGEIWTWRYHGKPWIGG